MGIKRDYDRAFKERAVKMSYERSNIGDLARELGIGRARIYKWRSEYAEHGEASFQGHGVERLSEEGRKVKELEKKLRTTELEKKLRTTELELDQPNKAKDQSKFIYFGLQGG